MIDAAVHPAINRHYQSHPMLYCRPLKNMVSNLKYDEMILDLTEVLKKLTPEEAEVQRGITRAAHF